MPFVNDYERDIHFKKHGNKFNATDAVQYENMADAFMFGAIKVSMIEGNRKNLIDRIRFNLANRHFGVASINPEFVKTFYPVSLHTVTHYGGGRGYFEFERDRTDV
jgi:hypothetical protein